MANQTVYPYGTGGSLPSSIGIINDLKTGGADKALSAEQGKVIGEELQLLPIIDLSQYPDNTGAVIINANSLLALNMNSRFKHKRVPIEGGSSYEVHSEVGTAFAFSTSNQTTTEGGAYLIPPSSEGQIRHEVAAGVSVTVTAPEDATYLWVTVWDNEDLGVSVMVTNGQLPTRLDKIEGELKKIEATPIYLSEYADNTGAIIINADGHLALYTNARYKHKRVPINGGSAYEVQAAEAGTAFAFSTSDETYVEGGVQLIPPSSEGEIRHTVAAGNSVAVTAPNDAAYLWITVWGNEDLHVSLFSLGEILAKIEAGGTEAVHPSKIIYVAASNSSGTDKSLCSFVCDGINDEVTIQSAINALNGNGEVHLMIGDYYIHDFPVTSNVDERSAVVFPSSLSSCIKLSGLIDASRANSRPRIHVTNSALALYPDTLLAVFNVANSRSDAQGAAISFANMHIYIDDDSAEYKYIAINAFQASSIKLKYVYIDAAPNIGQDSMSGRMPVEGSVGVRCTKGNNNMGGGFISSYVRGFYDGFQLGGEHLILQDCGAQYCYYGYSFGNYDYSYGVMEHPITLINCLDERNAALPLFAKCGPHGSTAYKGLQAITMIDFNIEDRPGSNPTGNRMLPASEVTPSSFCGYISFAANTANNTNNIVNFQFWASGCGQNFKTVNSTHKLGGTTAERNTYTPMYMQQYFDTDLNKMLIYNGSSWVDFNGTAV